MDNIAYTVKRRKMQEAVYSTTWQITDGCVLAAVKV